MSSTLSTAEAAGRPEAATPVSGAAPGPAALQAFRASLAGDLSGLDDAGLIDLIRALEEMKSAAAAAQARLSIALEQSQRAAQTSTGVPARRLGRGIGAQIALARREAPTRGGRYLGLAHALTTTMPHTLRGMELGLISEWRAMLILREIACLSDTDQRDVDRRLAADTGSIHGWGDRRIAAEARRHALALDNAALAERARRAPAERRVTVRPAPDAMVYLSALLPMASGIAAYAALRKEADTRRVAGDERGRGQVMADTLIERITGHPAADPVPVDVRLVITDRTLLAGGAEPALLPGYGHVPAEHARSLIADAIRHGERERRAYTWLRALYTHPDTGSLLAMSSRRRTAPAGLADLIDTRDLATCRTPWCDAPIRHHDHITPAAQGGATSLAEMQGLCEACNYTKQAPGWIARTVPGPRHTVQTITPTGHAYQSRAPAPPGTAPDIDLRRHSRAERAIADLVYAA